MDFNWIEIVKKYEDRNIKYLDELQDMGYLKCELAPVRGTPINLSDLYRWDFTDYIMYLIAADLEINIDEVEVYRYLTGYNGDNIDSIKENIEERGIMSYDFQSKIPVSLKLMIIATNKLVREVPDADWSFYFKLYLLSFIYAGRVIMSADECVSYKERRNFEVYIKNLIAYIDENSYVRFSEPLTNLLLN